MPALSNASQAMPAVIAPSPMIATTLRSAFSSSAATAMPSAALIDVLECPTPKVSYSLSARDRKGREPAALLDGVELVAPAGEHLVRIGLVADVPHQPVARRLEDVVQRHRELDGAEARGEMSAARGDAPDQVVAQLRRRHRRARFPDCARRSAGELIERSSAKGSVGLGIAREVYTGRRAEKQAQILS